MCEPRTTFLLAVNWTHSSPLYFLGCPIPSRLDTALFTIPCRVLRCSSNQRVFCWAHPGYSATWALLLPASIPWALVNIEQVSTISGIARQLRRFRKYFEISSNLSREGRNTTQVDLEPPRCREASATCAQCSRIRTQPRVLQIEVVHLRVQLVSKTRLCA